MCRGNAITVPFWIVFSFFSSK
uniref:Uncharacterized protein n=1 Tax=Arundo donax TaxID=35708 RepID=A0A0A9C2D6_ARUDO